MAPVIYEAESRLTTTTTTTCPVLQMLPHESVIQSEEEAESKTEPEPEVLVEMPQVNFAQNFNVHVSSVDNFNVEIYDEAMEVEDDPKVVDSKIFEANIFHSKIIDSDVEHMDVDETKPVAKNRFDYRPLMAKENSSSASSSSSSVSGESEAESEAGSVQKVKSESTDSSEATSDRSSDKWPTDKSDEKPLIEEEPQQVVPQSSKFMIQLSAEESGPINNDQNRKPTSQNKPMPNPVASPKQEVTNTSFVAAKPDFTVRTFGPQPYTRKEIVAPTLVQFEVETEDCIVDLRRSFGGFRTSSGRFAHTGTEEPKIEHLETSKEEREEAMDDYDEGEAKSFSLPFIQTESEVDGRKSAQGIPEVEKKLSFAEPNLSKVPSDGVIAKGKKLSTFSLHSAGEGDISIVGVSEELPLQRRNSIHNVPYVDVNDPATRERMERYKEERRSMLRAKYRVEDYREKPPVSPTAKPTTTALTPEAKKQETVTSPGRKSADYSVEKTSPDLNRFRKISTSSADRNQAEVEKMAVDKPSVDRMSIDKSPKVEKMQITKNKFEEKVTDTTPIPALRKLPVEKSTTKPSQNQIAENFSKQLENSETPVRKWSSNSRTSLNSFDNKKVSVSIIEPEVTLRKVTTMTSEPMIIPTSQHKSVPIVTPRQEHIMYATKTTSDSKKHAIFPTTQVTQPRPETDVKKHVTQTRNKLTSRASCPVTGGLVEEDVNVRERAALFNSAAAHRANQAELRTKFVSLIPAAPSNEETKNNSRKSNSGSIGKLGGPGSPSKIKNIAALFEQKT